MRDKRNPKDVCGEATANSTVCILSSWMSCDGCQAGLKPKMSVFDILPLGNIRFSWKKRMLDTVMYICMCERKGGIILKYCCDFNRSSVSISNNLYIWKVVHA